AMAGTDLFTHIRYMLLTTVPTLTLTVLIFVFLGLNLEVSGATDTSLIMASIEQSFNISPWLFIVPVVVIGMIARKTEPLIALLIGCLLGGAFALIFQPQVVAGIAGVSSLDFHSAYKGVMDAITVPSTIPTDNETLKD